MTLWIDSACSFCSRLGCWLRRRAQRRGLSLQIRSLPVGSQALVFEGGGHRAEAAEALVLLLYCLGGLMRCLASVLRLLPAGFRQRCYSWVARHRYRLFGRSQCANSPQP